MLKSDLQYSYYESPHFDGAQLQQQQQQQQPSRQIPDHLKCGEVYTWLCAGELYAVECKLCEDKPLCPLSEFPQHMEIWHTQWEETSTKTQESCFSANDSRVELQLVKGICLDNFNHERILSFTTANTSSAKKTQAEHEETLEPFEQVLIEQDLVIDTIIQISEEVNEEEYCRDINEQAATAAAETGQFQIENKQQQAVQTFVKQNLTLVNKESAKELTTVKESDLQHLTDTKMIRAKSVFYPAENDAKKKQNQNQIEPEISGNETSFIDCMKTTNCLKKSKPEPKSTQQNYSKLNQIKRALNRIIKDICDLKETNEMEGELSVASVTENETSCLNKEILREASSKSKKQTKSKIKVKQFQKYAKPEGHLSSNKQNLCGRTKNFARKHLRANEKTAGTFRRTHRKYHRTYLCQADRVARPDSSKSKESFAGEPITEKLQERNNSLTTENTVDEEICISAKDNDQINVLEYRGSIEVGQENKVPAKETVAEASINSITSTASAQDWNEATISDQVIGTYDELAQYCNEIQKGNLSEKQQCIEKTTMQTLDIQGINSKAHQKDDSSEPNVNEVFSCSNSSLNTFTQHIATTAIAEPVSPLSPKTEEEHFEFYEPMEKLNKQHISHLIELYHGHARLWDQSHPDFCEPQMCRKSWQQLTEEWNKYCKRKFTVAEVRIRICTLCQRFVQEKDRLALEGELDECAKFPYYEQMKFLEHQKSLRKRRVLYEQQNEKIVEIYQYFPILWHVRHYKSRQAKRRAEAFESISKVLKLFGWHLSSLGVQKRLRSLRKCYRLEKIRHLHAQVEQTPFEVEFLHYEKMKFLHKHIDPFVCRICGKIFENLPGFREHLEIENHGSISQANTDTENNSDPDEREEDTAQSVTFPTAYDQTESENSTDILQRFMPIAAITQTSVENSYSQNLTCFSLNTPNEALINAWPFEDQLIEEIMENVTTSDGFSQHGLDQFINSVTSCEELTTGNTKLFEEVLSPSLLQTDSSFIVEHPDIISGQTCSLLSPLTNNESSLSVDFGNQNSLNAQQGDLITDHNFSVPLPAEETVIVSPNEEILTEENNPLPNIETTSKQLEKQVTAEVIAQQPSSSTALLVKVQCADYSVNLKLNTEPLSTLNPCRENSDNDLYSSGDNSTAPLPDLLIHKMIELYRKFPQLWDPNHLDFNSRTLKRQAWVNLTTEFNSIICKQLSWRTLHRKLTDYAKYYKKLVTEQANYENFLNKWLFYEDFKFLDDVMAVNTELQRSVHHRDNNFKIISTYKSFPQLWNIKHPDFSKRSCKQRNIELMCNRLQEENNLQLTTDRLKNRLIELRAQYRMAKKQRLKSLKTHQQFSASEFEFYEALNFLDDHIDPFVCDKCEMEFKKLTDYNQHWKKEHAQKKQHTILPAAVSGMENVCHICGIKFTSRSNLVHHIKRHEGIRNYACTMCGKKFYASHALKVHIRSHTKECPYTCEKCGMSFVSASKLNQHVKRHLNQKDFECSYCSKTFFTAFEKDRHERRHLNIRDKVCPICGKTFVAGSSYYAHLMLHNDTKRFECDKCDMKFAQYPGLFKHKKRHHT